MAENTEGVATPKAWSSPYRWVVLVLVFGTQMFCAACIAGISPVLSFITEDLGMSMTETGVLFTAINLGTCIMAFFTGKIIDKTGVRKVLLVGQVLLGIFVAVESAANSLPMLLGCLFLAGIFNSVASPCSGTGVTTWFSPKERGTAMGVKQAGIPMAGVVTGLALPPMAIAMGWRTTFLCLGIFIAIWGVISFFLYRDSDAKIAKPEKPNTWAETKEDLLRRDIILVLCGSCLVNGMQYVATSMMTKYLITLPAVAVVAAPAVLAGALYSLQNFGGMFGRIGWGIVSDRFAKGKRKGTLMVVGICGAISVFLIGMFGSVMPTPALYALLLFFGVTAAGWLGLGFTFVSELAGMRSAGSAIGALTAVNFLPMFIVPPIFGAIVDASGWTPAFMMLFAMGVIGLICWAFVREDAKVYSADKEK